MVEIAPLLESSAALTEFTNVESLGQMPTFNVAPASGVTVIFTYGTNATRPETATAILSIPPAIPGRPDLTFEFQPGEAPTPSNPPTNTPPPTPTLKVPEGALGRLATLALIPLPPDDERIPPRTFAVKLAANLPVVVQNDDVALRGKLVTAVEQVPTDQFVARLFQGGAEVSNAALVSLTDGGFSLLLPSARAEGELRLQISPRNPSGMNPSFVSDPIAFTANVGTIKLPAYTTPEQFQVMVVGPNEQPVSGALVRASTILPQGDPSQPKMGSTVFQRDGIAAVQGSANLSLIPGTAVLLRDYELAVIPPADSPFATRCFRQSIAGGSRAGSPASLPPLVLSPRRTLSGTVAASDGRPLPNVVVTATTSSVVEGCAISTARAASRSATTGQDGTFQLPLDPGSYQLDFAPPAGSPVPRFTQPELVIVAADADVDGSVRMPAGRVVEGRVQGPDKKPLPLASVKIYQPRCSGAADCFGPVRTAPWLIAVAQTDASGRFRAIVPDAP